MVRHGQLILNDSFRRVECSSYLYFYITNPISELWSLYQHGYGGKKKIQYFTSLLSLICQIGGLILHSDYHMYAWRL